MSVAPVYWSCFAVTALTAIGTSESAWLRRVAVMTISPVFTGCSRAWSCAAAPSVAPGVGCAVCLSVSVLETAVCANAGVATAKMPADSSHADLRIICLSPSGARTPAPRKRLTTIRNQRKRLRGRNDVNAVVLKQFGNSGVSSGASEALERTPAEAATRVPRIRGLTAYRTGAARPGRHALQLFRRKHHQHLAAFHARMRLDLCYLGGLLLHPAEHRHAELAMRHLTTAEAHGDLHLVAFLDELEDLLHLRVIVVVVDVRTHLDLLDLLRLLLLALLGGLLLGLVFVAADVEELRDRRVGVGRNLDQIEPDLLCLLERFARKHH